MFTGLTLGVGEIAARRPAGDEVELTVRSTFDWRPPLALGESVAVSGVCLTVTAAGSRDFIVHASAETLARAGLELGRKVNLERALTLHDRLGGHLVSGHVDGQGRVAAMERVGGSLVFTVAAPPELMPFIVPKGSIAVDGVSLTVNQVGPDYFTVNLIPHSAAVTTLGGRKVRDSVNLETDLIGKYVHRFLTLTKNQPGPPRGLTFELLARQGFGR